MGRDMITNIGRLMHNGKHGKSALLLFTMLPLLLLITGCTETEPRVTFSQFSDNYSCENPTLSVELLWRNDTNLSDLSLSADDSIVQPFKSTQGYLITDSAGNRLDCDPGIDCTQCDFARWGHSDTADVSEYRWGEYGQGYF
ncbi:MAG: hypothetical protein WBC47_08510, partial [Dehalococcoidia bacterium]